MILAVGDVAGITLVATDNAAIGFIVVLLYAGISVPLKKESALTRRLRFHQRTAWAGLEWPRAVNRCTRMILRRNPPFSFPLARRRLTASPDSPT